MTPSAALPIISHILTTPFPTLPIQLLPAYLTPSSMPSGFLPASWPHWITILPLALPNVGEYRAFELPRLGPPGTCPKTHLFL